MSRIYAHPRGIKREVIFQIVVLGQGAQTHLDALHKVCCTVPSKMSLLPGLRYYSMHNALQCFAYHLAYPYTALLW